MANLSPENAKKNVERMQKNLLTGQRLTFIQGTLLVVGVVGVFSVLSIWAPVSVLLFALVIIAFVGGASLGKGAAILVPAAVVIVIVRAELVAAHPVEVRTFLFGGIVFVIMLGVVALVGVRVRRLLRRLSTGQQPSG
jgi:glycerol-3-phosphate acyltransferase PlsY